MVCPIVYHEQPAPNPHFMVLLTLARLHSQPPTRTLTGLTLAQLLPLKVQQVLKGMKLTPLM